MRKSNRRVNTLRKFGKNRYLGGMSRRMKGGVPISKEEEKVPISKEEEDVLSAHREAVLEDLEKRWSPQRPPSDYTYALKAPTHAEYKESRHS